MGWDGGQRILTRADGWNALTDRFLCALKGAGRALSSKARWHSGQLTRTDL